MIEFDIKLTQGNFRLEAVLQSSAQVIGLFGPSGAGKSTLLNVLAGNVTPANGKILINGKCLLDTQANLNIPMHRRRIGMVYQEGRLFPHLPVKTNLAYGMRLLPASERRFDFDLIVNLLELGHLLDKRPHTLSGGERQRVALGRALLASPDILLLDEPMASLDDRLKAQILPFLCKVKEQTSVPMIYVSHSLREILALTQQLAIIQHGEILACGNFHDVFASDAVFPMAQSLGLDNLLAVKITEQHPDLGFSMGLCGDTPLILPFSQVPLGSTISVVIPASNIALSRTPIDGISIQNQLRGKVSSIRVIGHRALIGVDIGTTILVEITEKSVRDMGISTHDSVCCLIKTQAIRLLEHSL